LALGLVFGALERPAPLFVNLGAGDALFARGFRAGWERDGLTGSGETMFHWTADGARLEFPVEVADGELSARLRLARFSDTPATITLLANEQVVDQWLQKPRGWEVRRIALGPARGQLTLQFRSEAPDGLGVALDWVEVEGVKRAWPEAPILGHSALLLFGLPLLLGFGLGRRAALAGAVGLWLLLAAALLVDRLGAMVAFSQAAIPVLLVATTLLCAGWGLRRAWPDVLASRSALAAPLVAATLAVLALNHPFFYYPDVETHARFVAALRADPYLAVDATEYQLKTGTWATRLIGNQRVLFPYSPAFHVVAAPLASLLGDGPAAVKAVGVFAFGIFLLLVHALARGAGLGVGAAVLAQAIAALLPVEASRLSLALYPGLLGQACDLLLVVHLVRRYPHLAGARDMAAAFGFFLVALFAYTGSLFNVAGLVALFVGLELVGGDRRAALRVLGAYTAAAAVVFLLQYARFVPVLWHDVLPHREAGGVTQSPWRLASWRLLEFHGGVLLLLVGLGLIVTRGAKRHVRGLLAAMLGTGLALLWLRYAAASIFKDAKELELLAGPTAVLAAAALGSAWGRSWRIRLLALAALGLFLHSALPAIVAAYRVGFVAIGRG